MREGRAVGVVLLLLVAVASIACDRGPTPAATVAEAPEESQAQARPVPVREAVLDERTALSMAALPLACLDRPQSASSRTGYLYARTQTLRQDFENTRAFYGCYDWHSAVNSTWMLVTLLRRFPNLEVAPLIVEKLRQHLSAEALAGEEAFFIADGNRTFERPYGWAWFLALHGELSRLDHPAAAAWRQNTAQLAEHFATGLLDYLDKLDYPMRVGTHANTAFSLDLALDFALATGREGLASALVARARELYLDDVACPLAYEPSASDFLSPCLEEAKVMAVALPQDEFVLWLDNFLPSVDSVGFERIASPLMVGEDGEDLDINQQGARSHLIGLAFTRAEGLARVASALPVDDPRVEIYRRVAEEHSRRGLAAMFDADYLGSHWIGTFAVRYMVTAAP